MRIVTQSPLTRSQALKFSRCCPDRPDLLLCGRPLSLVDAFGMPKAEVGSTKWLGNKMKAKGLQRLRWYCQVCERQMRDANGFKQHTLSESHIRQMQIVGQNANKFINDYSNQFKSDFLQLLRTSHGEKKVNINHFYQEYIANKEHVHMNATKWPSLTEFAKFLGKEGVCRVEEGDRGLEVSWVDNSPEALRRQAAILKRERQDKGDEEREQKLIQEQVRRAREDADLKGDNGHGNVKGNQPGELNLQGLGGFSINLNAAGKKVIYSPGRNHLERAEKRPDGQDEVVPAKSLDVDPAEQLGVPPRSSCENETFQMNLGGLKKAKNVFAVAAKKNASNTPKSGQRMAQVKPMTEAERIMREELGRKRPQDHSPPKEPSTHKRIRM